MEVAPFHLALGGFNGVGQNFLVDGGVVVDAQPVHHAGNPLRAEQAHEVVFQREIKLAFAWVPLAAGPAPQLVVDAAGFVALGADDAQAPGLADELGVLAHGFPVFFQIFSILPPGV